MLRIVLSLSVVALAVADVSPAVGQSRCDCDVIVNECRAYVTEVPTTSLGSRFLVKADTEQCAIVEWTIDGTRGQTTVWDDGEEIDRVTKAIGSIAVQSCRVCEDRLKGAPDGVSGRAPTASTESNVCGPFGTESEADIRQLLRANNMTPDQMIARIRAEIPDSIRKSEEMYKGLSADARAAVLKMSTEGINRVANQRIAYMQCLKANP